MSAVDFQFLERTNLDTDGTTKETASITPVSGAVYYIAFTSRRTAAAPVSPATVAGTNGFSGTWTLVNSAAAGDVRISVYRSTAVSGTAGVITATWADTQLTTELFFVRGRACLEATVQSKPATATAATALNFDGDPLAAFAAPFNATLVFSATSQAFGTTECLESQGRLHRIGRASTASSEGLSTSCHFSAGEVSSPALISGSATLLGVAVEIAQDGSDLSAGGGGFPIIPGL